MRTPIIVIGGGLVGLNAALRLCQMDMRPVVIESLPVLGGRSAATNPRDVEQITARLARLGPLILTGRRAAALWGGLEQGFSVETNTGETITGAAVILADGDGPLRADGKARSDRLTGVRPVASPATGETETPGAFRIAGAEEGIELAIARASRAARGAVDRTRGAAHAPRRAPAPAQLHVA